MTTQKLHAASFDKTMPEVQHLLVYQYPLEAPDGSSVFLRRFYTPLAERTVHLFFEGSHTHSTVPGLRAINMGVPEFKALSVGRGFLRRLWFGGLAKIKLLKREIKPLHQWLRSPTHRVHVVVGNEQSAESALNLIRLLGSPKYLLHVMDILHDEGLSPRRTPYFIEIVRKADACLALCQTIADEIQPYSNAPVEVAVCFPVSIVNGYSRPHVSEPFTLVMAGALYHDLPEKTAWLSEIFLPGWKLFTEHFPAAQMHYYGRDYLQFPSGFREFVKPQPWLEQDDYTAQLHRASASLLPVVHLAHDRWRFSIPSRLADFLNAGLPLLCHPMPGTATQAFLSPLLGSAVFLTKTPNEVFTALMGIATNPTAARAAASAFAQKEFSSDTTARRMNQMLALPRGC